MINKLLKPVRELFDLFRKQNTVIKVIIIIAILIIARVVTERLTWGIFSQTYLENFGSGAETAFAGAVGAEMVLCHMNSCGHCKKMMPEWDKFQKTFKKPGITVNKVEKDQNPKAMQQLDIQGFPSIMLLNNGKKVKDYEGERTASAFAAFANAA